MVNTSPYQIHKGYLVSQGTLNNSFVVAKYNPTQLVGVLKESTLPNMHGEVATSGVVKVHVADSVQRGDQVRAIKSGDRGYQGQAVRVKTGDTDYFLVGEVLQSGTGLVDVSLRLQYVGQGNGNPTSNGLTDVLVTQDPSYPLEYLQKVKDGETSTVTTLVKPNGRVWGGDVSWVSGLTFNVKKCIYYIKGQFYSSEQTNVTLQDADPSLERIDVICATNTGSVVVLTGTPSATPIKPVIDPDSQVELTFIRLGAGATTPNLDTELIYDENTEAWTCSGANSYSLKAPLNGFYCTEVTSLTNVWYTKETTVDLINYTQLSFNIKLGANLRSDQDLYVQFWNDTTPVTTELKANVDKSTTAYQLVTIPVSGGIVNKVRFRWVGTFVPYFLDVIKLENINQGGTNDYRWNFSAETPSGIVSVPVVNGDTVHFAQGNNITLGRTSDIELGHVITINAANQVQADWDETEPTAPSYILNKPNIPTVNNTFPICVELWNMTAGDVVTPMLYLPYACTINSVAVKCDTSTAVVGVAVGVTPVEFNSSASIPVTTTKTLIDATGHNTASIGDTISVVLTSKVSATKIQVEIIATAT